MPEAIVTGANVKIPPCHHFDLILVSCIMQDASQTLHLQLALELAHGF